MIVRAQLHVLREREAIEDSRISQPNEPIVRKWLTTPQEPTDDSAEDFHAHLQVRSGIDERDLPYVNFNSSKETTGVGLTG